MMQRHLRLRVIAGTVMVVASVAVSSFADLRAAATAMDCCLKTNYACAGLSARNQTLSIKGYLGSPDGPSEEACSTARRLLHRRGVECDQRRNLDAREVASLSLRP